MTDQTPQPGQAAAGAAPVVPPATAETPGVAPQPVAAPQPAAQPYAVAPGWAPGVPVPTAAGAPAPGPASYGYAPPQPPYGTAPAAGSPPPPYGYPAYPGYAAQPPAPPRPARRWPWVVAGFLLAFILLVGGCASCAVAHIITSSGSTRSDVTGPHDYAYPYGYDDDDLDYDELYDLYHGDDVDDGIDGVYTYGDVMTALNLMPGDPADGAFPRGLYRVGADGELAPGRYHLGGTDDAVGEYYVFERYDGDASEGTLYQLDDSVIYFGGYFTDLDEGDLIAFLPPEGQMMEPASDEPVAAEPPYVNGCYRVGVDIPAGTYEVTVASQSAAVTDVESGAFVMRDLAFDEDSIVETRYVIAGGRQRVTVVDGQYLELFAAQAVPAEDAEGADAAPAQPSPSPAPSPHGTLSA
ncbi:MAG: hypothetical protein HFJ75_04585 [Eggerthellaceae bacterium]|nr:hypothetical protein [Eggerthellaceae bacterium]